jgi:excisionase family DNA binding protein
MESALLSIPAFCREYSVSRSLTYRLIRNGDLAAVKVGRLTRIRREDAEAWAATLAAYKPAA